MGFSYRDHSLQTNTEVLFLVKLQLLQGNPSLSYEFIVAKLVFVAHRQPEDRRQRGLTSLCFLKSAHRAVRRSCAAPRLFSPESFARHLLVADAVVDQSLVPHGVQGVFECLGAELVGLMGKKTQEKTKVRRETFMVV